MDLEQRIARLSPKQRAILERKLNQGRPTDRRETAGTPQKARRFAPLSFSQERLWFLEQMEPESCIYNLPTTAVIHGAVNPGLVEECVRRVIARHSALRTSFVVRDDSPCQVVSDAVEGALDFSTIDLRSRDARSDSLPVGKAVAQHIWVPFDLAAGPLVRVRLLTGPGNENVLLVVMHHIVSDGWSINLFMKEFRSLYEAAVSGDPADLPDVGQYADYARAQREALQGDALTDLLSYWRRQLEGAPSVMELPFDRRRPVRQSFSGALHSFGLPNSVLGRVKSLCSASGAVPFMVLLSAFKVLLFRYTNHPKVVVGTPIANRNRSELEPVIGLFANTLVLCSSLSSEMTFRQLVAQVRETTLGAYDHQDLPFEKLVSELQPERSLSYNPIFQVMFTFLNLPSEKGNTAPPSADAPRPDSLDLGNIPSKFDLTLAMTETDDGLSAVFEYSTDLFDAGTIERMADHLANALDYVLDCPDAPIGSFSFLSESEWHLIVDEWNDTAREWPEILPVHGRFERWAMEAPDSTAVVFKEASLTYRELDERANRLAHLLHGQGVGPGGVVGICMRRSLDMVIGLFGILKAGAAYMPIDTDFPEARIRYMLDDAKASHVLTTHEYVHVLESYNVTTVALDRLDGPCPDGPPPVRTAASDLAYVIFTSGSTGGPKGVMVSHGAIYNRLQWMQERYRLGVHDRIMQKTPFTFDVSVWEFFWPLSEGARLVVAEPERHKESRYLVALIENEGVTCLHFVPSMLQAFLYEDLSGCDSLTRIVCSGEALTVDQCRRLQALPGVSAHNLYGPTEAAVDVTHWDCDEWRDQYLTVPIGRPIANTQIYILNADLQPAPIGVSGELHIGGANLAEGYLNKSELTQKTFIDNPFSTQPGERLYKTGDLARFRPDGNIEYVGRIDAQVKLRGVRMELDEIESVLREHPEIADAAVIVSRFGEDDDRLAAYVIQGNPESHLDVAALRTFAARKLPNYMIPTIIAPVPELPLSANGKLDRKRLPAPTNISSVAVAEPLNDIEEVLLDIWTKFLKIGPLKTTDDFFALGGHSILAFQVINSINRHYQLDLPVRMLFENPTITTLAKALSGLEDQGGEEAWRTAGPMATPSPRRLIATLDELSEEQLDAILLQSHDSDGPVTSARDPRSLLAWAREYLAANTSEPAAHAVRQRSRSVTTGGKTADAEASPYGRHYPELVKATFALEQLARRPYAMPDSRGASTLQAEAERLRERVHEVFTMFARDMEVRLSNGTEALPPAALRVYCHQMLSMADLAIWSRLL